MTGIWRAFAAAMSTFYDWRARRRIDRAAELAARSKVWDSIARGEA